MKTKIAILCSDDAHHGYLVSLLQERFEVVAVVVEPAASQRQRLRRNRRYRDYAAALYHYARRTLLGLNAYRRRYFADRRAAPGACPVLTVEWINDPAVVDLLRRVAPAQTIVIGTSILRAPVLEAAGEMILNVHGGYLPYYRGNHCFFFALYHGAFDKVGATIHFVDPGIDTGDIVEVVVPAIYPDDNAETLYCRADKMAIHRLVFWLEHLERGGTLPRRPQPPVGRLYRTRDRTLRHDLGFWLRRATGRLVLPAREPPPQPDFATPDPEVTASIIPRYQ